MKQEMTFASQLRLQLRKRAAERRLDLAAAHPAALAPILRDNAVLIENQRRLLRRLLVRQTLKKRHRLQMAALRVLCLACHDALFRSRPIATHRRRQSDRKRKTDFTQKYEPHPFPFADLDASWRWSVKWHSICISEIKFNDLERYWSSFLNA